MTTRGKRKWVRPAMGALGLVLGLQFLAVGPVGAQSTDASRYPYDPVCPWGRIADGRGMLVRCITEAESKALRKGGTPPAPPPSRSDAGASADSAASGSVKVDVGPVLVESGNLPEAEAKLRKAKDRFAQCVTQHGGMTRNEGEVRVRFLVRERGRAEGVEVTKRRSVGEAAARCIADVVDRRAVGLPDVPMLAATLVVKLSRQDQ